MATDDELVEILDENGDVERIATRTEMRIGVLRHRSTYVLVRRSNGAYVFHRRADWKDVNPGIWDLGFGGVVSAGEGWLESAERELAEEAGLIDVPLTPLGEGRYEAEDGRTIARVFLAESDAQLTCPDGEVAELAEVHDVQQWLSTHEVCGDSLHIVSPFLV